MSERRSRWNELLGVPNEVREPDLYQILGFERLAFDSSLLEERFRERMHRVQEVRSTKHKEFIEFVKGELRRARRILADERDRAEYDRELVTAQASLLGRTLGPALALGRLEPAAERVALELAREIGLTEEEARATIDAELARTGARRGRVSRRLADVSGLSPDEAAAVAADEAAQLAKLAAEAAARAMEAARRASSIRTAKTEHEVEAFGVDDDPPPKKKRSRSTKRGKDSRSLGVDFCGDCGVSLPARWGKSGEAERIGTRLLCAACATRVRSGETCCACSREIDSGDGSVPAKGEMRLCASCATSSRRLKACAKCQVLLPRVAIERGEARTRDGRLYCKDCLP
jgi:hypothetical protein